MSLNDIMNEIHKSIEMFQTISFEFKCVISVHLK
jgi:hypothetical protein